MVVALLSLGSTTVNVGMWSSSPCVVCVVSKLAMKSCILVGMDVISQAKVAVVRAYRLGVFREGSEFVLTLRTGPHRSVPLAVTPAVPHWVYWIMEYWLPPAMQEYRIVRSNNPCSERNVEP